MELRGQRVAVYARYSTDKQNPRSIADQLRVCREYVARCGGAVDDELVFSDAGISGTSVAARPGFVALQDAVRARLVDVIVTEDLSRIGRDVGNNDRAIKQFKSWGARLLTVHDGIDTAQRGSKFAHAIKSVMAEEYIDELRDRTKRGMAGAFDAGLWTGGRAYGYRSVDAGDSTGRKRLEVDPSEADVVRRIFADHVSGFGQRDIAERLNAAGVVSPRGGKWTHLTVRSMLGNELYAGVVIYNRRAWSRDSETGKRTCVQRPRTEWRRRAHSELRIIDASTWEAAQQRRAAVGTKYAQGARPKRGYPLSGLLVCGCCGELLTITIGSSQVYYACGGHKKGKGCSNARSLPERAIRAWLLDTIRDEAGAPELLEQMRAVWASSLGDKDRAIKAELAQRRAALTRTEAQISKLLDFIVDGHDTPSTQAKLREKEDYAELQRATIARLEHELELVPTIPSVARMRAFLQDLPNAVMRRPVELRHWLGQELLAGPVRCTPPAEPGGAHRVAFEFRPAALLGSDSGVPGGRPGTALSRGGCGGRI